MKKKPGVVGVSVFIQCSYRQCTNEEINVCKASAAVAASLARDKETIALFFKL
jgi:hypothetical protein